MKAWVLFEPLTQKREKLLVKRTVMRCRALSRTEQTPKTRIQEGQLGAAA